MTVTGHALLGYTQIRERQAELEQLYRETFGESHRHARVQPSTSSLTNFPAPAGDEELLGRAMRTWWFPAVWGGTTPRMGGTRAGGTTGRAGTCCTAGVSRCRWSGWCGARRGVRGRRGTGRTTGRGRSPLHCGACRRGRRSPPTVDTPGLCSARCVCGGPGGR